MNTSDRHLRFGWWSLFVFLTLGVALETLHGFKIGWYLDVDREISRLMLTLSHAHGTLLALVNIGAGLTLRAVKGLEFTVGTSRSLIWGSILLPVGFLLGGLVIHDEGGPMFVADAAADPISGLLGATAILDRLAGGGRWLIDLALARAAAAAGGPVGGPATTLVPALPRHRTPRGYAAPLGEHTDSVLRDFGC